MKQSTEGWAISGSFISGTKGNSRWQTMESVCSSDGECELQFERPRESDQDGTLTIHATPTDQMSGGSTLNYVGQIDHFTLTHGLSAIVEDASVALVASDANLQAISDDELDSRLRQVCSQETPIIVVHEFGEVTYGERLIVEILSRNPAQWEGRLTHIISLMGDPTTESRARNPLRRDIIRAWRRLSVGRDPLSMVCTLEKESIQFPEPIIATMCLDNEQDSAVRVLVPSANGSAFIYSRHVWLGITDEAGHPLPIVDAWTDALGPAPAHALVPGDSACFPVDLRQYRVFSHPGVYRVDARFHFEDNVANYAEWQNRLGVTAKSVTLHVLPHYYRMSENEERSLRADIRKLGECGPIPIIRRTWSPSLPFVSDPQTPADRVFRRGWDAIAVLVGELAHPGLDRQATGAVLGMLWNLTGIKLCSDGLRGSIFGSYQECELAFGASSSNGQSGREWSARECTGVVVFTIFLPL